MVRFLVASFGVLAIVTTVSAAGQTGTTGSVQKRTVPAPKPTSIRISVKDQQGASLEGVRLLVTGASTGEFTTGAAGTAIVPNLKPGMYRVRSERDGYVTLEREFTLGASAWNPIDIVLNALPPPPKPEPPAPPPAMAMAPSGPALTMSIPDFLEKNYIGREAIKESIVACKPLETVRLLQIKEGVAAHAHDRSDETIYIVAGEGGVRIGDDVTPVRAGSLIVVPAGSSHGFERRGKTPLVVMSMLTGSACETAKSTR